jgi:ferredoxin-NADP reductase
MNPEDKTKINLVYSNTMEEDILLHDELMALQKSNPERFKIHFTLT